MALIGYCRVSAQDQNLSRQILAMEKLGISGENIFLEKASGKDFQRPVFQEMMKTLKNGDTLYLAALDRLGRNYAEIQDYWRILTKEMGVDIVILDMPLLNTTTHKDLMGTLISDIVLQLLSYVATVERANLLRRQADGIAAAHARGVKFGRPPKPRPAEFPDLRAAWANHEISAREAARTLGITHRTFLLWARDV